MADAGPSIPDDVNEFLENHTRTILLTLRRDGSPTAHPMTSLYGDGRLSFTTYRKSAKTLNVQRDPRTACLVTTSDDDSNFQAVVYRGRSSVLEGREMPQRGRAGGNTPNASGAPVSRAADRLKTGKRIIIEVSPDEVGFLDEMSKG